MKLYDRHIIHISRRYKSKCPVDYILPTYDYSLCILDTAQLSELNDLEQYYIQKYNTLHPNGLNFNTGGQVYSISQATKDKISKTTKGRVVPQETIEKHYYPVKSIDKNGNEEIYKSVKHAGEITGINSRHISECARNAGVRKTAGGYKWEYITDKYKSRRNPKHINHNISDEARSKIQKKVDMYDTEGNYIMSFDSVKHAGEYVGSKSISHISTCAKGKRKTAYGFIWKYH